MHYLKYFYLIIIAGILLSSCEKNDNSVIDPILHFPVIDSAYISPTTFDTSNIHITAYCHVSSVDPIQKITADVINPLNNKIVSTILTGDANNNFNGVINIAMDCRIVGQYQVEFTALSSANLYSVTISKNFNVINSHHQPPVISNLIIYPRDFTLNVSHELVFLVNASDPDGECDIKTVHYYGHYPNMLPLTEESLFDDGSCCIIDNFGNVSGDTTAGDGKFTRFFGVATPQMLGYYVYHIIAINRSLDTSNVLSDSIYVHQ